MLAGYRYMLRGANHSTKSLIGVFLFFIFRPRSVFKQSLCNILSGAFQYQTAEVPSENNVR